MASGRERVSGKETSTQAKEKKKQEKPPSPDAWQDRPHYRLSAFFYPPVSGKRQTGVTNRQAAACDFPDRTAQKTAWFPSCCLVRLSLSLLCTRSVADSQASYRDDKPVISWLNTFRALGFEGFIVEIGSHMREIGALWLQLPDPLHRLRKMGM